MCILTLSHGPLTLGTTKSLGLVLELCTNILRDAHGRLPSDRGCSKGGIWVPFPFVCLRDFLICPPHQATNRKQSSFWRTCVSESPDTTRMNRISSRLCFVCDYVSARPFTHEVSKTGWFFPFLWKRLMQ